MPSRGRKRTGFWRILARYFYTVSCLRPVQIVYRVLFKIKFLLYAWFPSFWERVHFCRLLVDSAPLLRGSVLLAGLQGGRFGRRFSDCDEVLGRAERLLRGEFVFLNSVQDFSDGVSWQASFVSHLWRYQLHYFNYAWDLGVAYRLREDRRYCDGFKELVESWIDRNALGSLDGWHPYTISLRAVNWVYAWEMFGPGLVEEADFSRKFLRSLYKQFDFLFHNLEFQGYGNHLLANIKALIFGGIFFRGEGPRRWLRVGLRLLEEELKEQILSDGGHFERTPMYHLIVMKDLIEILAVLRHNGYRVPEILGRKIEAMAGFAGALRMPDGSIPLLNDAAYDLAPDLEELVGMARWLRGGPGPAGEPRTFSGLLLGAGPEVAVGASSQESPPRSVALRESGYFIMRSRGGSEMVIDCGPVCPDYLPPHAHADTLSYEFWVGGQKMIGDSGTYEYAAGKWRNFFRSTRAHNTVVVDGEDQSEVWGSFRVARRAYPRDVVWISTSGADYFAGSHDGYRRLKAPVEHRRRVLYLKGAFWLVLDAVSGEGAHCVESFVHFHPEVEVRSEGDRRLVASRGDQALSLFFFGCDSLDSTSGQEEPLIQGWYSPEFGLKFPRKSFRVKREGSMPLWMGYVLIPGIDPQVGVEYVVDGSERYEIRTETRRWVVEVDPEHSSIQIR